MPYTRSEALDRLLEAHRAEVGYSPEDNPDADAHSVANRARRDAQRGQLFKREPVEDWLEAAQTEYYGEPSVGHVSGSELAAREAEWKRWHESTSLPIDPITATPSSVAERVRNEFTVRHSELVEEFGWDAIEESAGHCARALGADFLNRRPEWYSATERRLRSGVVTPRNDEDEDAADAGRTAGIGDHGAHSHAAAKPKAKPVSTLFADLAAVQRKEGLY